MLARRDVARFWIAASVDPFPRTNFTNYLVGIHHDQVDTVNRCFLGRGCGSSLGESDYEDHAVSVQKPRVGYNGRERITS